MTLHEESLGPTAEEQRAKLERVMAILQRAWAIPNDNPDFSEGDLYDEHGAPK